MSTTFEIRPAGGKLLVKRHDRAPHSTAELVEVMGVGAQSKFDKTEAKKGGMVFLSPNALDDAEQIDGMHLVPFWTVIGYVTAKTTK